MMDRKAHTATEFARTADLPAHRRRAPGTEDTSSPATPPDFSAPDLAVTIGSQISSFSGGIDAPLREAISNAFLFAQQVADKQLQDDPGATSSQWYATYIDVLSRIGWSREEDSHSLRKISGASANVHDAIIPVVAAALGPAAAASAVVIKVLEGLSSVNENSPWIVLFNKSSQRAHAAQFQVSHVDMDGAAPRIRLVAFELEAERDVSQVLFFRFSADRAELRHFETKLSVDQPTFSEVAPILRDRLAERARDFILSIEF